MTDNAKEGYVQTDRQQGIATITFFHPAANTLPAGLLTALTQALHDVAADSTVKVVVIQSAGEGAFCSGASFNELQSISTPSDGKAFFSGFAHVINAMRACPHLIIVRVQGKSVGGGLGIIAAADYAIAKEGADIKLSELTIGIGPFVVGPAIERKIGAAFYQLAIDAAQWRTAAWALQKGLFAEVHPDAESLNSAVERLSNSLSASNPEAMLAIKKMSWHGTEHWNELLTERAAISGRLVLSRFTQEALIRFRRKK